MIRTNNLRKIYTTEEVETTALDSVNIEIKEKEFVAIMGPSGCGKSTLLNIFGLLDNPSDGKYYFLNEEVSKYTERQRANMSSFLSYILALQLRREKKRSTKF